jgi:hypothetical protein
MPDDPPKPTDPPNIPKKREGWNIRPFPEELKIACQQKALAERKYDYEWVADKLRQALGISSEGSVLDSPHESGKEEVRRDSGQANKGRAAKALRSKAPEEAI